MNSEAFALFRRNLLLAGFEEERTDFLLKAFARNPRRVQSLAREAFMPDGDGFLIERCHALTRLLGLAWKLEEARLLYREKFWSEEVFWAGAGDLFLRQELYHHRTGRVGLSRRDGRWLKRFFAGEIFKLGSLQFQPGLMRYDPALSYDAELVAQLSPACEVLIVHIQAGADLRAEAVEASFALARQFFGANFSTNRFQAFVCASWLLYPGLKAILPRESRIAEFSSRFQIVGQSRSSVQALERIFGGRRRRKCDYPQETQLQRAALLHPEALGFALGAIFV